MITRDPLPNAELSQGSNLYWYVANNAVNNDPTGKFTADRAATIGLTQVLGGGPEDPLPIL
jgi:hypothetical protein